MMWRVFISPHDIIKNAIEEEEEEEDEKKGFLEQAC